MQIWMKPRRPERPVRVVAPISITPEQSVSERVRENVEISLREAQHRRDILLERKLQIESELDDLDTVISSLEPAFGQMLGKQQIVDVLIKGLHDTINEVSDG